MNYSILIPFCVIAVSLVTFLIVRNKKDEQIFGEKINDVLENKKNEGDIGIGEA